MTENENMTRLADHDDAKPTELAPLWTACENEIYRVVDEDGVNVGNAQCRRLDAHYWLYVDDKQGYSIEDNADALGWLIVRDDQHVPYGWDGRGHVIEI